MCVLLTINVDLILVSDLVTSPNFAVAKIGKYIYLTAQAGATEQNFTGRGVRHRNRI